MALTISEANAVNVLARHIGKEPGYGGLLTVDDLRIALSILLAKAHKSLGAGLSDRDVDRLLARLAE